MSAFKVWFLAGPTASGKTEVAHCLARRLGCEILSADSMQVYRGLDIGTAKPSAAEREGIVYHGLDLAEPTEAFSAGLYLRYAAGVLADCQARGVPLLVAGGTGLYLQGLLAGFEEEGAASPERREYWSGLLRSRGVGFLREALEAMSPGVLDAMPDSANPRRLIRALERAEQGLPPLADSWSKEGGHAEETRIPALFFEREALLERIELRIERMFASGLVEEVRGLMERYSHWSATAEAAIGYAEVRALLRGDTTEKEARERIAVRTRQLAKRQRTWFRNRTPVEWIAGPRDTADVERCADDALRVLSRFRSVKAPPESP